MMPLREVSLFSGIGGFSLAAKRLGIQTIQHVEIDSRAQKVLSANFPKVWIHANVRDYHPVHRGADLFTISFPCTNTSNAGDRTGLSGTKSSLWFEALRCIVEGEPPFVVIENPPGLIHRGLRAVLGGLRMAGYRWEHPTLLSSSLLGAADQRERLFIIAYHDGLRWKKQPQRWPEHLRTMAQASWSRQAWPQFIAADDGVVVELPTGMASVPVTVPVGEKGRLNSRILIGRAVAPAVAAIPLQRVIALAECVEDIYKF
jgi:DNA (cytosine-5)-methyltransferase 1